MGAAPARPGQEAPAQTIFHARKSGFRKQMKPNARAATMGALMYGPAHRRAEPIRAAAAGSPSLRATTWIANTRARPN